VPAAVERLARVVPGWRVEVLPEAGHALVVDEPELVLRRLLAFPPAPADGDDAEAAGQPAATG
jgi:pimeloyl-ACP methyl ester carboxylesterase